MIKGTDNIIKFVDTNDCAYWKIYPHGSGRDRFIFESSDSDNLSKSESLERLRDCLSLLSSGRYIVQCKQKATTAKGFAEIAFEHEAAPSSNMNAGMATTTQVSGLSKEEVGKMIADAVEADRTKRKLEDQEKEITELKKQVKEYEGNGAYAVLGRIFDRVEPHLNTVVNHYLPPKPQIASVGYAGDGKNTNSTTMTQIEKYTKPTTPPTSDEEAKKRLQAALNAWVDIDPENMLAIVETVAHTAHNDKPTYDFYAKNLK